MIKFAEIYHSLGFSIIPLKGYSKVPKLANWTKGDRLSLSELRRLVGPKDNIGVRLGRTSRLTNGGHLIALDVDVKGTALKHLKEAQDAARSFLGEYFDQCPRAISGRGGGSCHYYFGMEEIPANTKIARSKELVKVKMPSVKASKKETSTLSAEELAQGLRLRPAWEVELLSEGKQIVLPPSIHPDTGKAYAFDRQFNILDGVGVNFPIISMEKLQILEHLRKKSAKGPGVKTVEVSLAEKGVNERFTLLIQEGFDIEGVYGDDRSNMIFAVIVYLVGLGLDDSEICSVMTDPGNAISEGALERRNGDQKSAMGWILPQVQKARFQNSAINDFDGVETKDESRKLKTGSEIKAQKEELCNWESELDTNKYGVVLKTTRNLRLILENDPYIKGRFAWNELSQSVAVMAPAPFTKCIESFPAEIDDPTLTSFKVWFSERWCEVSIGTLAESVVAVARARSFHPVRDYLRPLKWDGVKRLDSWLTDFMGVEADRYTARVGRKTLMALVKRAYFPGCKFDHCLIFEGDQGKGKSSALEILGGEHYADFLGDVSNKDSINFILGKWLVELGEMYAASRSDVNALKSFISRRVDRARLAYGRFSTDYQRQCVFIGTTNQEEYLKDETGARRFWPVLCQHEIDLAGLSENRDQLFAEAKAAVVAGESLNLEQELWGDAKLVQDERFDADSRTDLVRAWLDADEFDQQRNFVTINELWTGCFGKNAMEISKRDQLILGQILKSLGWKKIRILDGKNRKRGFSRPGGW